MYLANIMGNVQVSETGLIGIIGASFAFLGVALKYSLASKCSDISLLWGIIQIRRDVKVEEEIEIERMNHQPNVVVPNNIAPNISPNGSVLTREVETI